MSHKKGSASLHLRLMTCKSSICARTWLLVFGAYSTLYVHVTVILYPIHVCRIVVHFMLVYVYMCLFFFVNTCLVYIIPP